MSLKHALLGLLSAEPMNGYAIKTLFDEAINHVWQAELSQIYRELSSLEEQGLVTSVIKPQLDRPNKRVYSVTDAGRKAFDEWLAAVPETFAMPKRDEFMLRLFFGSAAGKDLVRRQFERLLAQMRAKTSALREPSRIAERYPNDPLMAEADRLCREDRYCGFIRDGALRTAEAVIGWAEACLSELASTREPGPEKTEGAGGEKR